MPWRIEKDVRFEAAHQLPLHDGKCARLHGHSWKATLVCESDRLEEDGPKKGMVLDYGDLSLVMKPLLESHLDHHYLNESLKMESPTSEMVARWIFDQISPSIPQLVSVIVEETCTARCEYRK